MSILHWSDAYCRLLEDAFASRGSAAGDPRISVTDSDTLRDWPNTRGADVLAIAAVVDSALAQVPADPGGRAARMQWQLAIVDLEDAFEQPTAAYRHNRSFWSSLLGAAAYLDSAQASLPADEVWDAVLAVLWSPVAEHRNGADDRRVRILVDSDAEKMWSRQHEEHMKARGYDLIAPPPPSAEAAMKVPRTTNADAIRLYEYWSKELLRLMVEAAAGRHANTMGLPAQRERWTAIRDDIDELARKGKPDDIYAKNRELWHETRGLAVNLAVWGEQPSTFDLVLESTGHGIKELPTTIGNAAGAISHAIGDIGEKIGAGLLSALGKPLLIGGGVVLGSLLLWRLTGSREEGSHG